MPNEPDMDAPVTRRELHQALEIWAARIIDTITERFIPQVTEQVTEQVTRRVTEQVTENVSKEIGRATAASAEALRLEFRSDLAQATTATAEVIRAEIRAIDDQYKALPPRVDRLEREVFKPKPKRRARS